MSRELALMLLVALSVADVALRMLHIVERLLGRTAATS